MAFVDLASSPLAPGVAPVRIHVREAGHGAALVVLHGGWGIDIYPFDIAVAAIARGRHVLVPERSGYGRSTPVDALPVDFHRRAAEETVSLLDTLGLERPVLWGHSDGAIIAILIALALPDRIAAVIVEATHFWRSKPSSRAFFEAMARDPSCVGDRVAAMLERDHGRRWRCVVAMHADAWLRIGEAARSTRDDFYDGHLSELAVPALLVHGARDPRTEPGELEALRRALETTEGAGHRVAVFEQAGHSPHSEPATAAEVARLIGDFTR